MITEINETQAEPLGKLSIFTKTPANKRKITGMGGAIIIATSTFGAIEATAIPIKLEAKVSIIKIKVKVKNL